MTHGLKHEPFIPYLTEQEPPSMLAFAAILNSAFYLIAVIVIGLLWGNRISVLLAVATFGANFLSYAIQIMLPLDRVLGVALVSASICLGILAGVVLAVWS